MSCSCISATQIKLGFKGTRACSRDQGDGLLLECKIGVTWMTIIFELFQSLFVGCQVHLIDKNKSELRKLVKQH
jgi:hypothetical protein